MLGVGLLGDCRNDKLKKKATDITTFAAEEVGRGFPGQRVLENRNCLVATEKWEGAYEKGAEELPRNMRSSQPSVDSFICVG